MEVSNSGVPITSIDPGVAPLVQDDSGSAIAEKLTLTSTSVSESESELTPAKTSCEPLPAALAPLTSRVKYFLQLWLVKFAASLLFAYLRIVHPGPAEQQPTYIRRYAVRPHLPVRIFFPLRDAAKTSNTSSHDDVSSKEASANVRKNAELKAEKQEKLLSLYISIHGGGFAVGTASQDDSFCSSWSRRTGMLVASLNYSKTPQHPFPTAVYDIANLICAVVNDPTLPIDKFNIVVGGFSAGGHLALSSSLVLADVQRRLWNNAAAATARTTATAELDGIKDDKKGTIAEFSPFRIAATVSYYPIVDFSHPPIHKYTNRLCRDPQSNRDSIATAGDFLDWGFVPAGQNRRDKILSPCYAVNNNSTNNQKATANQSKEKLLELPARICIIGAQRDMLCREARDMVYNLAGLDIPSTSSSPPDNDKSIINKETPTRKDENGKNLWTGFETSQYKWMLVQNVRHGFTDEFLRKKGTPREKRRREIVQAVYEDVHRWLSGL